MQVAKRIAVAVVQNEGSYLIGQRPVGVPLAGLWEFPGGKVEPGETAEQAAARECFEEAGLEVTVGQEYPSVVYEYDHGRLELHFFACRPRSIAPSPRPPYRWAPAAELSNYRFPEANATLLAKLIQSAAESDSGGVDTSDAVGRSDESSA